MSLYSSSDDVVELTQSNFKSLVLDSDEVWLVEFYAPWCGHCKALAPEYKKAATALKGVVRLGAIDMDKHKSAGQPYGVEGFPTIKLFGLDKKKPVDYNQARQAKPIVDFCMNKARDIVNQRLSGKRGSSTRKPKKPKKPKAKKAPGTLKGGKVIELDESTFESEVLNANSMVFVKFYAPWCGHCKALAPKFAEAAKQVPKDVILAKVDCTQHQNVCQKYQVQGYPTLKFFVNGEAEDYNGGRTTSDIVTYCNNKNDMYKPPLELAEMVNQQHFVDYCEESKALCVIAFLPDIRDSGEDGRKNYLKELKELEESNKGKPINFLWVQGGQNFDFEESLGLRFGFPALVSLHWRKQRFSVMRKAFNKANIKSFVGLLSNGRARTQNIPKNLPKVKDLLKRRKKKAAKEAAAKKAEPATEEL